jgi:[ribosomal protein S5]-alanine N-acetyltransferase
MLPLRSRRLVLRVLEESDLPTLVALLGDGDVMKLALYERPFAEPEARRFIDSEFAKDSTDITKLGVLCLRPGKRVIGFAGMLPCKYLPGEFELGFVLAMEAQRRGFATEIGKELIDVGFRLLGRDRLYALCDPRNLASRAVLSRKLGMTFVEEIATPDRGQRLVFQRTRNQDSIGDGTDSTPV